MRVRIPPGNLTLLLRLTSPSIFLPFSRCPFPTRLIDNVNAGERGHGREETSFWMSNVNPSALHKDTTGKSVVCAAFAAPPANAGTRGFRNVFLPGIFTRGVYTRDSLPPPFLLLTSHYPERPSDQQRSCTSLLNPTAFRMRESDLRKSGRKERIAQGFPRSWKS